MIKAAMRAMAVIIFALSLTVILLVQFADWAPNNVTVGDVWFLTSCIMLTILSKGK